MAAVLRAVDRWHQLADAIQRSNMSAADKSVFRFLLDRADYRTAELPAKFTPTQRAIGRSTSHSRRQVQYSLDHLSRHGWITAEGATGPGRPRRYSFASGADCDCQGRVHAPERAQPEATTGATTAPERAQPTGATQQVRPQIALRGSEREGVERQVSLSTSTRLPPDWPLINRLVRIVHNDPCGGLHREALAERLHLPARGRVLGDALGIAYRNKKIDFCGQYVVKPVTGHLRRLAQ
jgi:hypothetical protein